MTTPKLTLKLAKELIAMLGGKLIRNTEWDEYIVRTAPGETYHCTDLDDAMGTALAVRGGSQKTVFIENV